MKPSDIREWEYRDYNETCDPELTEAYNGFTIEVRFYCACDLYEDGICGLKLFIIASDGDTLKYFTDSYIYPDNDSAFNAAAEIIDNGRIPE